MPPRPHDAEEPESTGTGDGAPDADAPTADEGAEAGTADAGADPARAADGLDPADVDARWARIVTELGAGATDPRAWAPDPAVEEAENHFVPPDPGPVLGGDPLLTMAWLVVVGVPLLLMVAVVAWRDIPAWVLQAAGVAFLAGVGLLLWRMPRDREDDPGPGAVV